MKNWLKGFIIIALTFAVVAGFLNSCKKTTENQLINGIWVVKDVYLDTMTTNYLNTLPDYTSSATCCYYKIDFQDDGSIWALYTVNNTQEKFSVGVWDLDTYNKLYMKFDNFIDGTFDITKPTTKHWQLNSTTNHIQFLDGTGSPYDTSAAKVDIDKI